jgi:hypothetical protein
LKDGEGLEEIIDSCGGKMWWVARKSMFGFVEMAGTVARAPTSCHRAHIQSASEGPWTTAAPRSKTIAAANDA